MLPQGKAPAGRAEKLAVLRTIALAFEKASLPWAVGGSTLLACKGVVADFRDLDLLVAEEAVERADAILSTLGERQSTLPHPGYKTHRFLEYTIAGVEVDVMAGLVITEGEVDHHCPLEMQDVTEHWDLNGVAIPLHSLHRWRQYYLWMGRAQRVAEIDAYLSEK